MKWYNNNLPPGNDICQDALEYFTNHTLPVLHKRYPDMIVNMDGWLSMVRLSPRSDNYSEQHRKLDRMTEWLWWKDPISWLVYMYLGQKYSCTGISQRLSKEYGFEYKSVSLSHFLSKVLHIPMRKHTDITTTWMQALQIVANSRERAGGCFLPAYT